MVEGCREHDPTHLPPLPTVGAGLPDATRLSSSPFGPRLWDLQPPGLHPEEAAALG